MRGVAVDYSCFNSGLMAAKTQTIKKFQALFLALNNFYGGNRIVIILFKRPLIKILETWK